MSLDLTAVVLTFNEESNLPDCLGSLRRLGCPVFVVDSGSTDRTLQIAEQAGAKVVEHPFKNYGAQRNWAQAELPMDTQWLLHLDADERLTPELSANIERALAAPHDDTDGFLLRRRTVFMGRWIRHGGHYPSFHARLYRRDKGRCEDRLYDQHFIVDGKVEKLSGDMIDETSDLSSWSVRHAKWAKMEAKELVEGKGQPGRLVGKLGGSPIERRRWLREHLYGRFPLFVRPFLYFIYRYVFRLGFLDGKEGLVFHFLQGCWYRFQVDAYLLEARLTERRGKNSRQTESEMSGLRERQEVDH
jgi:glycosyltransferase involved in cell wall biosynthesis